MPRFTHRRRNRIGNILNVHIVHNTTEQGSLRRSARIANITNSVTNITADLINTNDSTDGPRRRGINSETNVNSALVNTDEQLNNLQFSQQPLINSDINVVHNTNDQMLTNYIESATVIDQPPPTSTSVYLPNRVQMLNDSNQNNDELTSDDDSQQIEPSIVNNSTVGPTIASDGKFSFHLETENISPFKINLSDMKICTHCLAVRFPNEGFDGCCRNGNVKLPSRYFQYPLTQAVRDIFNSELFPKYSYLLNKVLSFAYNSTTVKINDSRNGHRCIIMNGAVSALTTSLQSDTGSAESSNFAQIWALSDAESSKMRHLQLLDLMTTQHNSNIPTEHLEKLHQFIEILHDYMLEHNPYAKQFKTALASIREEYNEGSEIPSVVYIPEKKDSRKYCRASSSDFGISYSSTSTDSPFWFVTNVLGSNNMTFINMVHPMFLPMRFPLLFLHGEDGWNMCTLLRDGSTDKRAKRLSMAAFSQYICQRRVINYQNNFMSSTSPPEFEWNPIHIGGALSEEYYATLGLMVEQNQLTFHAFQQKNVKCISSSTNILPDDNLTNIGKAATIDPSSMYGTPSYFTRLYQMTMHLFDAVGPPNLFLTFTMNPTKAREVEQLFNPSPNHFNKNDLISRVFMEMVKNLNKNLEKLLELKISGKAWITEFQKRGLPHIHMALRCPQLEFTDDNGNRIINYEVLDRIVKRCQSDSDDLNSIINSVMVHKCTKERCRGNNIDPSKCIKGNFPRKCCDTFEELESGRILPPGGKDDEFMVSYNPVLSAKYGCHINLDVVADGAVVRYIYKYMTKGSDKIKITRSFEEPNEEEPVDRIKEVIANRYMSGIEGSYTVLNKFMAGNKPAVVSLPVHNENGFSIYYDKTLHTTADVIHMQNQQNGKTSKLFGFFKLNTRIKLYVKHFKHQTLSMDERFEYSKAWDAGLYKSFSSIDILTLSSGMFYRDVNTWFTWNVNKKEWYARVRKMSTIGYIQTVSPLASDKERYYVSVLLEYVPSPCSHEDLKCGFESFESACINKGLIGTDDEYVNSISNLGFTPANARNFANILISSKALFHPSLFIDKVFDILTSDLNNIHYRNYGIYLVNNIVLNSNFDNEIVKKRCYLLHIFRSMNLDVDFGSLGFHENDVSLCLKFGLPETALNANAIGMDLQDMFVTSVSSAEEIRRNISSLTPKQKQHYDTIINCVLSENDNDKLMFLDAPAGSGKTFLTNTIIKSLRVFHKRVVIAVGSTGIAALLMENGLTAHKMFSIPIHQEHAAVASMPVVCSPSKIQIEIIKNCDVIFWDEITMIPSSVCEGVDAILKEIKGVNEPFGGCVVVFSGDFRQCLPVILDNPSLEDVFKRSILCSSFSQKIKYLRLTENMRIMSSLDPPPIKELKKRQAKVLLDIGSGFNITNGEGLEDLGLLCSKEQFFDLNAVKRNKFLNVIYPKQVLKLSAYIENRRDTGGRNLRLENRISPEQAIISLSEHFESNCVLTPKNLDVKYINKKMMRMLSTKEVVLSSYQNLIQTGVNSTIATTMRGMFLHEMDKYENATFPPNKLSLKVGCPIMLLRNIDMDRGLVNGTRLIVSKILERQHVLKCIIIAGSHKGESVDIPRIMFQHEHDSHCKLDFTRKQFPVRVCFSMTIMKSQGQTFTKKVGIYLPKDIFSHGQLYVALSRCTDIFNLTFCLKKTSNRPNKSIVNMVCGSVTNRLRSEN